MMNIDAQRVRTALEREGIVITPSRPMPKTAARAVARPQRASHPVALTFCSYPLPAFTKDHGAVSLPRAQLE